MQARQNVMHMACPPFRTEVHHQRSESSIPYLASFIHRTGGIQEGAWNEAVEGRKKGGGGEEEGGRAHTPVDDGDLMSVLGTHIPVQHYP